MLTTHAFVTVIYIYCVIFSVTMFSLENKVIRIRIQTRNDQTEIKTKLFA